MKKLTTIAAATLLIIFLMMSCDKDKYHRDRYIGDWDFVTKINYFKSVNDNAIGIILEKSDTIYYLGKITYGTFENDILIQYTDNDEIFAYIDNDKKTLWTEAYPFPKSPSGFFEENNKIFLNLVVYYNQNKFINHSIE
jgi:hypothetical protein